MFHREVEILFLSKAEVESLISVRDAVAAAEQAFKALAEGHLVQYHTVLPIKGPNMIATATTYLKSLNLYGLKQADVYRQRDPGDNLPMLWGSLIVLTRPENALPYAIMDGTSITNMRTAGGHVVVAAKYLARKDSKTLAVIGCGAEGRTGFQSLLNNFPLELVKIYDLKQETVSTFLKEMSKEFTVRIVPATSAKEAVAGADIILMATSASELVVLEPWVEKGCFVAGVTAFRDLDPVLSVTADKWVLGTHELDNHLIIEGHAAPAAKEISRDNVYADMGEIVTGTKPGRENDQERIVYTHMGMGAHDVILANMAYNRAAEKGKGRKIYL